jgi:hypothetical protein
MTMENLHNQVTGGQPWLPFGSVASAASRTKAEWAQLHSGIEFIQPEWERDCAILMARGGWTIALLAGVVDKDEYEIEVALGRVTRTLATWERNACKWSTRYVAVEPQACAPDGASERDQRRERTNRRGSV